MRSVCYSQEIFLAQQQSSDNKYRLMLGLGNCSDTEINILIKISISHFYVTALIQRTAHELVILRAAFGLTREDARKIKHLPAD